MRSWRMFAFVGLILGLGLVTACAQPTAGPRLRIINQGSVPISNLEVWFPDERIPFGTIAPGQTTEYKSVPKGVYSYAAYNYDLSGETITQPVIDWVGESPMEGSAFTYTLDFDPGRPRVQQIQLVNVARDQ